MTILAKWRAFNDESIDIYSSKVQYYFEYTLKLSEGLRTHLLVYVKWYKSAISSSVQFKHSFMELEISNTELWKVKHSLKSCDSLLLVYRILYKATKFKCITIEKQNYVSIVPLNRQFNL